MIHFAVQSLINTFKLTELTKHISVGHILSSAIISFEGIHNLYTRFFWNQNPHNDRSITHNSNNYLKFHGITMLVSGLLTAIAGCENLFKEGMRVLCSPIIQVANLAFIYAAWLGIEENIRIYRLACEEPTNESEAASTQRAHVRRSAIIGMISNFAYIISTALIFLDLAATMALAIGMIAFTTGILKFIYDFFIKRQERLAIA